MAEARKPPGNVNRDGTITAEGMPGAVRLHGKLILVWNTVALVLALVLIVLGLAHDEKREIYQGVLQGIAAFLSFKFGQGLLAARKRAVCSLTVLYGTALVAALVFPVEDFLTPFGGIRMVIFVPALVGVLYLRPLISAFRHWDRFH
jgi:hypothetical protein